MTLSRPTKIIVATKTTGLEYQMHVNNLNSIDDARRLYESRGVDADRVIDSHRRQYERLHQLLLALGPTATVLPRSRLSDWITNDADLVISFGGDNHFIYVSHFCFGTPILPINSDPTTSYGGLLQNPDFPEILGKIREDQYEVVHWPKIDLTINGEKKAWATQEIFLGEGQPWRASFNTLEWEQGTSVATKKTSALHRGGGTLICNGVGSSGWYLNVTDNQPLSKTSSYLLGVGMNQFRRHKDEPSDIIWYAPGKIKITSNNDTDGIVVVDCLDEFKYTFPAGSVAEVGPSEVKTHIVTLK